MSRVKIYNFVKPSTSSTSYTYFLNHIFTIKNQILCFEVLKRMFGIAKSGLNMFLLLMHYILHHLI